MPDDINEPTYLNTFRYKNKQYDDLLNSALKTLSFDERNQKYAAADQYVINDAPIMPIFYEKSFRLLQPYVNNFYQNPMEYRSFRAVNFNKNTNKINS